MGRWLGKEVVPKRNWMPATRNWEPWLVDTRAIYGSSKGRWGTRAGFSWLSACHSSTHTWTWVWIPSDRVCHPSAREAETGDPGAGRPTKHSQIIRLPVQGGTLSQNIKRASVHQKTPNVNLWLLHTSVPSHIYTHSHTWTYKWLHIKFKKYNIQNCCLTNHPIPQDHDQAKTGFRKTERWLASL